MTEEMKDVEHKGISRREFAKRIAQGMVAFLVIASVGRGYATTCSGEKDEDCTSGGTEIDENCGSQSGSGTNYTYDVDNHCGDNIGTSSHRDDDDACGDGTHYDGTIYTRAHDDNCGSTHGVLDVYDTDDCCGEIGWKGLGKTGWDPDEGCSPEPEYDEDANCGSLVRTGPSTDTDNDGKS